MLQRINHGSDGPFAYIDLTISSVRQNDLACFLVCEGAIATYIWERNCGVIPFQLCRLAREVD